ncbi:MAG: mechanosensitive ion channel family protein [Verrucomicrobiota bacterium]
MLFISYSTFSAVLGSFLCAWALAPAQEVGVAQAFPLDQRLVEAEVELHNLSTLVRPLNRDELELVLQERLTHLRDLLNDIARHEVDFDQANEARKQELRVMLDNLYQNRGRASGQLTVVLDSLEAKGGEVEQHRKYLAATSESSLSVSDPHAITRMLSTWLRSSKGGVRWGFNLLKFLGVLLVTVLVSRLVVKATGKALLIEQRMSQLLEKFVLRIVRWLVLFGGLLIALTMLEIDIGPILAFIGAGGFIIGFALKDALGNFASGILILFYRPFDEGDTIEVAGIIGTVSDMNIVSTIVHTSDNKEIVIPNNTVWKDVITNANAKDLRRVDLVFNIAYNADIEQAKAILEGLCTEHPKILPEPSTTIRMSAVGPSSVEFICRPWAATGDYGGVKYDLIRSVKAAFDEAGIRISFPQQAVWVQSDS